MRMAATMYNTTTIGFRTYRTTLKASWFIQITDKLVACAMNRGCMSSHCLIQISFPSLIFVHDVHCRKTLKYCIHFNTVLGPERNRWIFSWFACISREKARLLAKRRSCSHIRSTRAEIYCTAIATPDAGEMALLWAINKQSHYAISLHAVSARTTRLRVSIRACARVFA